MRQLKRLIQDIIAVQKQGLQSMSRVLLQTNPSIVKKKGQISSHLRRYSFRARIWSVLPIELQHFYMNVTSEWLVMTYGQPKMTRVQLQHITKLISNNKRTIRINISIIMLPVKIPKTKKFIFFGLLEGLRLSLIIVQFFVTECQGIH